MVYRDVDASWSPSARLRLANSLFDRVEPSAGADFIRFEGRRALDADRANDLLAQSDRHPAGAKDHMLGRLER
jgi:hypothetical protein